MATPWGCVTSAHSAGGRPADRRGRQGTSGKAQWCYDGKTGRFGDRTRTCSSRCLFLGCCPSITSRGACLQAAQAPGPGWVLDPRAGRCSAPQRCIPTATAACDANHVPAWAPPEQAPHQCTLAHARRAAGLQGPTRDIAQGARVAQGCKGTMNKGSSSKTGRESRLAQAPNGGPARWIAHLHLPSPSASPTPSHRCRCCSPRQPPPIQGWGPTVAARQRTLLMAGQQRAPRTSNRKQHTACGRVVCSPALREWK